MPERSSWFTRVLVLACALLITAIAAYNFFFADTKGSISAELIILVAILVVIVLSESFDRFSVGKLLSLSREKKKQETEIQNLAKENAVLRDQIISITTSSTQISRMTNIMALPETISQFLNIQKATSEEILEQEITVKDSEPVGTNVSRQTFDRYKLEKVAISKFIEQNDYQRFNLIEEARFGTYFDDLDPIAKIQQVHDGYINTGQEEVFIEVRLVNNLSPILRDRLYMILTKLHYYRIMKGVNASLALILVCIANDNISSNSRWTIERFLSYFTPAISSSLLRVHQITIDEDELTKISSEQS